LKISFFAFSINQKVEEDDVDDNKEKKEELESAQAMMLTHKCKIFVSLLLLIYY